MDVLFTPQFWVALGKIIGVNIVLSGDNAVVIALAARQLPPALQKKAVFWGSAAAIVMRVILTVFAAKLLQYPWLKLVGSVLLVWIGVKLLAGEGDGDGEGVQASDKMFDAVRIILVADLVMSLDNVIAVAAAAGGDVVLLILGLAISIPLIIFGSTLLIKLMERYPIIITAGAALLGFVAGEMLWDEEAISSLTHTMPEAVKYVFGAVGAALVVVIGKLLARRAEENPA